MPTVPLPGIFPDPKLVPAREYVVHPGMVSIQFRHLPASAMAGKLFPLLRQSACAPLEPDKALGPPSIMLWGLGEYGLTGDLVDGTGEVEQGPKHSCPGERLPYTKRLFR